MRMSGPEKYAVALDDLVASAHVPLDDQVEEQDVDADEGPVDHESSGHLPGHVRPYGA